MQKQFDTWSVVLAIVVLNCWTNAVLLARPCVAVSKPWYKIGPTNRSARFVAMMGDNVGHSPFNTFPSMLTLGNCATVYFSVYRNTLNITILCKPPHARLTEHFQCPRYNPSVRWMLANLLYFQFDDHRFELSSCAKFNATHSYHGQLLLEDGIDQHRGSTVNNGKALRMWKYRLTQPEMEPFTYSGECFRCFFRNEYIARLPPANQELEKLVAEPFCVNFTHEPKIAQSSPASAMKMLHVILLCFAPFLLVGVLMLCRSTVINTVAPAEETDKA